MVAALGASEPAKSGDEELFLRPSDMRTVFFSSLDVGRSVFASAGVKQTLTGPLDRSGFVWMEATGQGLTREQPDENGASVIRHKVEKASLLGYQWGFPRVFLSAYAGPEVSWEQLTIDGLVRNWSVPHVGVRVQGELWSNPTDDTLLTASVVAGTARLSLWSRGSAGYRVGNGLYVGPEATVYTTETYRELRVGAHVTGVQLGIVNLRASGGWQMQDDTPRGSAYFGLAGFLRL